MLRLGLEDAEVAELGVGGDLDRDLDLDRVAGREPEREIGEEVDQPLSASLRQLLEPLRGSTVI
jgi:hypothetical protein